MRKRTDCTTRERRRTVPALAPWPGRETAVRRPTGMACGKFLAALLLLLGCCLPPSVVLAANLAWQALPDRERVTISMTPTEGMAGAVGRITPTGVLVPFTQIPPGLFIQETPQGAKLFKGTMQQGRALVFLTQTPEFGFLVSKQTPTELVVDFFHNPLGARWKATNVPPTTEIPPDYGVQPLAPHDAASVALSAEPEGKGPLSEAAQKEQPWDSTGGSDKTPAAAQSSPQAMPPAEPAGVSGETLSPGSGGKTEKPPVVSLTGSPIHATKATSLAEPPVEQPAPPPGMLRDTGSLPKEGGEQREQPKPAGQHVVSMPILMDNRTHTAERAAPLPVPEPPMFPGKPVVSAPPAKEPASAPEAAPSPVPAPVAAQSPAAPGQVPLVPNALPTDRPKASEPPVTSVPIPPEEEIPGQIPIRTPLVERQEGASRPDGALPGIGMTLGRGVYGGLINTSGLREPSSAAQSPGSGEAATQAPSVIPKPAEDSLPAQTPEKGGEQPVQEVPSTVQPGQEAPPAPAQVDGAAENAPPDTATLMQQLHDHIGKGELQQALELTEHLLAVADLDRDQREELLHTRAEMLFAINKDNFAGQYREISDATSQAISFNPKSRRNAGALLRLGYMNLKIKNLPEAEARFNMLRRQFPDDENVPLSYYYWGDYHFGRNELQKAADEFQLVLQKYPNSRYAREAALALARSFYRLGYYDQAFTIVDYIEKRWERFYLDFPPFLNMMGDVAFRLDKLDDALRHYWLYINLEPNGEEADIILTRLGDIYTARREKSAAREVYRESIKRFPDKDGALVAMMRLAEEGVNDDPSIAGMFSVFDGPFSLEPLEVYRNIIRDHPQSALVPLAKIKLAMWHLWKKEFTEALDDVAAFLQQYPDHELAPRAREIALQAFAVLAADSVALGNYGRMREIWERYPVVHDQAEILSPESRIALGISYWKDGKPNEALEAVAPFFLGNKVPEYSEMALSMVLSIYLEFDQWQAIREVARRVDLWEIKPESRRQLDYALALAYENQAQGDKAAPIWQKLYDSDALPAAQKAYAAFFLARYAEKERELERAYTLGREALDRLLEQVGLNNNPADIGKIKSQLASLMDVAETAGRLREALGFAEQYLQYLSADEQERVTVRYRMARIYKKQGDLDKWKSILTDISTKNPDSVYGQIAASELKAASIAEDAARYSPTGRL